MASSLVAGAVSIILILIAGYVIGSGILAIGETTVLVQTEVALNQEQLLQTSIAIDAYWDTTQLWVNVTNTGSTSFSPDDLDKTDIFTYDSVNKLRRFERSDCSFFVINASSDIINQGMWDPSEIINLKIITATEPEWVKFVTSNGVSASTNV